MGPDGTKIVLGDFNIPHTSWNFSPETGSLVHLCALGLFQVNGVLKSMGIILDLVFLEDPSIASLFRNDPISVPEDSYHTSLLLSIEIGLCLSPTIAQLVVKGVLISIVQILLVRYPTILRGLIICTYFTTI